MVLDVITKYQPFCAGLLQGFLMFLLYNILNIIFQYGIVMFTFLFTFLKKTLCNSQFLKEGMLPE